MSLLDDFDFDSLAAPVVAVDFRRASERACASWRPGVTIVTTSIGEQRNGLTATAVCSLSAEPPMLLACVNREAGAHDPTLQSRVFCVNLLGAKHPRPGRAVRGPPHACPSASPPATGARSRPAHRSSWTHWQASTACSDRRSGPRPTRCSRAVCRRCVPTRPRKPLLYSRGALRHLRRLTRISHGS